MESAVILGLMSGTSLDGLDLCLTQFELVEGAYEFEILKADSVPYSAIWQDRLRNATALLGEDLQRLNVDLGNYKGRLVNEFLKTAPIQPNYIASHGHTVFHQPENGFTLQIGDGYALHSLTNIPVIYNFRNLDIALNGQGAPLVPIGDLHLFGKYVACINFGGIANISFQENDSRLAFDICPVNMALSDITKEIDLPYDDGGNLARKGVVNRALLKALNDLEFYKKTGPKSLGIEWYNTYFKRLIKNSSLKVEDRLATVVEHVACKISEVCKGIEDGEILVTGGGVYNTFLIEVLQKKLKQNIVVPKGELIEFKEALIFAFLGWLQVNHKINTLKSVKGAKRDSSGGVLIQ